MHRLVLRFLLVAGLLAFPAPLCAQTSAVAPTRLPAELQPVARRAGTIFSGRVTSIAPARPDALDRVATVTVTFAVDQALRGVPAGKTFSFREWAGLWSAGPRYRVGQRLLMFLYAPSALGLTSPVGGDAGRLPVDATGQVVLANRPQPSRLGSPPPTGVVAARLPLKDLARELRRLGEE
jgi:hypothetical protein